MSGPSPSDDARAAGDGPRRRARSRLLLVGDEDVYAEVIPALTPPPVCVASLFDAIAEIDSAPAARPITAVLVPADVQPAPSDDGLEALRRLDPSVRWIRVADEAAGVEGFDGAVSAPVGVEALAAAVPELALEPAREVAEEEVLEEEDGDPLHDPHEPLGDTDLVEALLRRPEGLLSTAVRLVRQQTGWEDVELRPRGAASGDGRTAVEIPGAGMVLIAAASAEALGPWARWLERWLELDRTYRGYREMAYHDDLTGTWNRRYFHRFLGDTIAEARRRRRPVTVMVFDIDDFKQYNDAYGHAAGDVILRETVELLDSVIRACDRVCRIGGDEFAVVFADLDAPRETGSRHPDSVEAIARRFQAQVCDMRFPKLGLEAPGNLSISAGLATFPWDGDDPHDLLRLADERALESKRRGKNYITFGPGATEMRAQDATEEGSG